MMGLDDLLLRGSPQNPEGNIKEPLVYQALPSNHPKNCHFSKKTKKNQKKNREIRNRSPASVSNFEGTLSTRLSAFNPRRFQIIMVCSHLCHGNPSGLVILSSPKRASLQWDLTICVPHHLLEDCFGFRIHAHFQVFNLKSVVITFYTFSPGQTALTVPTEAAAGFHFAPWSLFPQTEPAEISAASAVLEKHFSKRQQPSLHGEV